MDSGSGGMASSSDFVRKLYKMLENPADQHIVRWGNDGSSFVVLENEKFTKHILPKHFKHSNFASFVRQLNKYDFHKVRHNSDEGAPSPYGPNAWEFQHPDFKMNNKTSLENIRRKTPATRKQQQYAQVDEPPMPTHQLEMLHAQLMASQQQIASLEGKAVDLHNANADLTHEVARLRDAARVHDQIIHRVVNFLSQVEKQRPQALALGEALHSTTTDGAALSAASLTKHPFGGFKEDAGPSPRVSNFDTKGLNQLADQFLRANSGKFISPPPDANGGRPFSGSAPLSAASSATLRLSDADSIGYPMGQTNGIDPAYGSALSLQSQEASSLQFLLQEPPSGPAPDWIRPPRILVVDDDTVCCCFGVKVAAMLNCFVVDAADGYEAIRRVEDQPPFDLVLMDIIMPSMDGIAATKEIRKIDKKVVIIAMTSNVKLDDINLYVRNGMLDVIGKPFTKPVLQKVLERALPHLIRDGSPRLIDGDSPTKDTAAWASTSGKTMFSATGMLSPAPSVNTLVNMTQGGGAMSMWLTEVMSAQEQRAAASQPPRAITNGAADNPRDGSGAGQRHDLQPGSASGQRRDISQISGGASEDRVRVKRQR